MRISDWSSDVCSSDLRRRSAPCRSTEIAHFVTWDPDARGWGWAADSRRRTPRPRAVLDASSPINSMPAASKAATTFMRVSMTPRTVPSLASMRWMVGRETPANTASRRWSMPSSARPARICPAVIIAQQSKLKVQNGYPIHHYEGLRYAKGASQGRDRRRAEGAQVRSEEHTYELQTLMRTSYAGV